jgi:hypothetical protein
MRQSIVLLLLLASFSAASNALQAQILENDKVILVWLEVKKAADIPLCYSTEFDRKRVEINFAFEDTINNLQDFVYEEDPSYGPDCFVPDLKLIFRDYTYVISLYCSRSLRYENLDPFATSAFRVENDLEITPGLTHFLLRLKETHFGEAGFASPLTGQVVFGEPLQELLDDGSVLQLLFDEEAQNADKSDSLLSRGVLDLERVLLDEEDLEEELDDPDY